MTTPSGATIPLPAFGSRDAGRETTWTHGVETIPVDVSPERAFPSPGSPMLVKATEDARLALQDAAFAATEAAASARAIADLLDDALAVLTAVEPSSDVAAAPRRRAPGGGNVLSPREQEVLALVTAGHSNKAIAAALYVSPNTVKTHVASLFHKLQADSRVQLAAIATRHGLQPHLATGAH